MTGLHIYLDLAHAHTAFTHCLAQLQDTVAVNVHHLNTPCPPIATSLQLKPKWHLAMEQLEFNVACAPSSGHGLHFAAQSGVRHLPPGGLTTAAAGRLGLHATHGHTQVLSWPTLLGCWQFA